ncbi:MAG: radical SAM protein [Fusobacteriaceae bacterium]
MFKVRLKSHHDVKNLINKKIKRKLKTPFSYYKILNSSPKEKDGGIYVHTPFCDKICSFCNMNRKQLDNDLEDYTNFLIKQIETLASKKYIQEKEFSVIFFGGGTPTIFKIEQLERILLTVQKSFKLTPKYEFTFETTLHNLSFEKLEIMEKLGVNRISIGVQTFSDRGRKLLNRTYDQEWVINRINEIKANFSGLVCVDIIYNYLEQDLKEVEKDAKILTQLNVDSSSFYSLMIHEGSNLSQDINQGKKDFDYQTERDKELHHKFLEISLENGYSILEHTKITSGRDSYNYIRNVHQLKDLIPIGIGAGGRIGDLELYNLNKYITFYSQDFALKKQLFLLSGLTQYHEVKLDKISEICGNKYSVIYEKLVELYDNGYIILNEKSYVYTLDGTFWGNNISALLVETLFNAIKQNNK